MKRYLLLFTLATAIAAQDVAAQDVYFAAIATGGKKAVIFGFLYKVGDSTVEIIPSRRRKDLKNIGNMEPVAIPIHVIEKVATRKVRHPLRVMLDVLLMGSVAGTATTIVVFNYPRLWLPALVASEFLVLWAYAGLEVNSYSPSDLFFREKLEDKALVKDERSIVLN